MRRHGCPQALEQLRLVAARMFQTGQPIAQIAEALDRSEQTVRAWRRVWRASGADGLKAKPHAGPKPKLTDGQWQQVLGWLAQAPKDHGYDAYLWTTPLMARLIHDKFGVQFHHDYVGEMLHQLGWSCQRPAKRAKERDEAAITLWKEQTWPDLLKKASSAAR